MHRQRVAWLQAVCPQLHGGFLAKLALLLVLIGGIPRTEECGTHLRGAVHMLLLGDTATGTLWAAAELVAGHVHDHVHAEGQAPGHPRQARTWLEAEARGWTGS